MDFGLTAEHEAVRQRTREFAEREIVPGLRERDREHRADRGMIDRLGASGILGTSLPQKYGGTGEDYISLGIVCEELERIETTARMAASVHLGLCCMTLLQWGTPEQKARLLPPLARGERIGAFGLTEPDAGSDAANIQTRARRDSDHYVLDGAKTWISIGNFATRFLIIAVTDPDAQPRTRGMTAFIVDRDFPGFRSEEIKGKFGARAGDTGRLFFEGCRVPVENRLGEEGDGFKIAMSALDHGRYTVASGSVGIITSCLEVCTDYAKRRMVGDEPIARKQLVQQMIAKMVRGRDIGRLLYYQVGWMKNAGLRHTREVSMAKWTNCDAAFEAANDALEILGAHGCSDEYPVERHLRNSRLAVIYEGTREIHTLMQAEYELGYREDRPVKRMLPTWPHGEDV